MMENIYVHPKASK